MSEVSFFSAFLGGILTFLAPCTLPLIPGYLAFIGGTGMTTQGAKSDDRRSQVMRNALLFVLGFSLIFILFGMASGAIGKFLVLYRTPIAQMGGLIIVYLGLSLCGLLPLPRFLSPQFPGFSGRLTAGSRSGALLLGILFALGWSPCLGPILGAILLLAATGGTIFSGGLLLSVYAAGLALPFLLVAWLYGATFLYITKLEPYLRYTQLIGGVMLIFVGALLVIGQFGILNMWAGELFNGRLFQLMLNYT